MQIFDSQNTPAVLSGKKSAQGRLIRFFLCMLAAILASQFLITTLINRLILPALQRSFLPSGVWDTNLTGAQLAVLLAGMSLILLLQLASRLFPLSAPLTISAQEHLYRWIQQRIPQISSSIAQELNGRDSFFLILITLGLLILILLPFVIFGWLYIRFVLRTTERILQEDERWHAEADRNRNLMLADIAHDIRNPMTTITGYAQALEDGMIRDPQKQQEYLSAIRRKSERVNTLIQMLFEYTKLNSAGFSLEKHSVDLCELLRECTAELYTDAEDKGLDIVTDIPDTPFSVSVDPVQLTRAVNNLLTNAIRHNRAGVRILIALLRDTQGDGDTRIVIADTGASISDEVAARIFEPFSRGDTSRPTDGGSGLGLSISASIIRMHGWELTLETTVPNYTKGFVIRIPW